jgi:EEF1A lysine methyltransferase 1
LDHIQREDDENDRNRLSVDEYKSAFTEDWKLSQFWYATDFANDLAKSIHSICTPTTNVAFVCCPTAYVASQYLYGRTNDYLFEVDTRFEALSAGGTFIKYDLNEPDLFPKNLSGTMDIAVVDPPYLNERTNTLLTRTISQLLRPTGKLILITSASSSSGNHSDSETETYLHRIYSQAPLGPLRKASLVVQHGRLANDFKCWGSWEGAEAFGQRG